MMPRSPSPELNIATRYVPLLAIVLVPVLHLYIFAVWLKNNKAEPPVERFLWIAFGKFYKRLRR